MIHIDINKNAPALASQETFVDAPVKVVWEVLSGLDNWPQWNESITKIDVRGAIDAGTEFRWVADGVKIRSRLKEVNAPNRIVWSGVATGVMLGIMGGVQGIHVCELCKEGDGTMVRTEESLEGAVVSLFPHRAQKVLDGVLLKGLSALKKEAESRDQN